MPICVRLLLTQLLAASSLRAGVPPVRARTKPAIVPLSEHLYSFGADKLQREVTINGNRAVEFVCWDYLKGHAECDCEGLRAHIFQGCCSKFISGRLGTGAGCTLSAEECRHHHPKDDVLDALTEWYESSLGAASIGTVSLTQQKGTLSRSVATASGASDNAGAGDHGAGAGDETAATSSIVPAALVESRLQKAAATSKHLQAFMEAPFLTEMLADESTRRLLASRGAVKEVSEAFAAVEEIRRLAELLGAPKDVATLGRGLTVLDVCSGKGTVAALLSRLLPDAQVTMLDACADMDLTHVARQGNLAFVEADLFSREAGALLHELATRRAAPNALLGEPDGTLPPPGEDDAIDAPGFSATVVIGMHLCGALSPRLLALCAQLDAVDAVAVCPCCLKGSLGDYVKKSSKAEGRSSYDVLLETLHFITSRELDTRGEACIRWNPDMLSPRNGFVSAVKTLEVRHAAAQRQAASALCSRRRGGTAVMCMEGGAPLQPPPQPPKTLAEEIIDECEVDEIRIDGACYPRGVRYRARVWYDGAEFHGMQKQPSGRSVACALEAALQRRWGRRIPVNPAGRTDTGVHARGQAVHFDIPLPPNAKSPVDEGVASEGLVPGNGAPPRRRSSAQAHGRLPTGEELQRSLNAMLPTALRLTNVEVAPEMDPCGHPWHARRWATGKLYSYRLHYGPVLDPLQRLQRHHVGHRPLDLDRMRQGAGHLAIGRLDCAALANRRAGEPLPIDHDPSLTTRTIRCVDVVDEGGGNVRVDVHVQSALYKMVRNMVGLLIRIGDGGLDPEDVPRLIVARDRSRLPGPAPAHGLTLESVYYADGWGGRFSHDLHPAQTSEDACYL